MADVHMLGMGHDWGLGGCWMEDPTLVVRLHTMMWSEDDEIALQDHERSCYVQEQQWFSWAVSWDPSLAVRL
jgi:hypothetical protein